MNLKQWITAIVFFSVPTISHSMFEDRISLLAKQAEQGNELAQLKIKLEKYEEELKPIDCLVYSYSAQKIMQNGDTICVEWVAKKALRPLPIPFTYKKMM